VTPATAAQLKKIVLRAADLPSWKAEPAEPASSDQAEVTKCVGAKNTDKGKVATAHSDDYTLGNALISSSASSYKLQSDVDSDVRLLKSPKLAPCYSKMFKQQFLSALSKDASLGPVSVKFTPGRGTGPANVVGSGSANATVTVNGQKVKLYLSFVYLTGPLMEAEIEAYNINAPVPAAALQWAVKAVADRAAATS
jgi:hypothetical protein